MKISKIKNIIKWVVVLAYFPVILAFVGRDKNAVVCSEVNVEIADSLVANFVSSEQIRRIILNKYPKLLGDNIEEINCEEIEGFVNKHEAIKSCEVYFNVSGNLNVVIGQREPLLRVFSGFDSYYLDADGKKMPLFKNHAAHVLVLSGHVNKLDSLNEVIDFARYIKKDNFWDAQIEQIYVESNGEFTLAPRVGDQVITFGKLDNYKLKMRNLYALYTSGLHPREWNNYKEINLKFEGQIICTKK